MPSKKKPSGGFSAEEIEAMKERARELARHPMSAEEKEAEVVAKIAEMPEPDRTLAQALHHLIRTVAPFLQPRTWYGMPAYADQGKVLCFFQGAHKFKTRYSTLGFTDAAHLDEGSMWPTAFALKEWNDEVAERVRALLLKATRQS